MRWEFLTSILLNESLNDIGYLWLPFGRIQADHCMGNYENDQLSYRKNNGAVFSLHIPVIFKNLAAQATLFLFSMINSVQNNFSFDIFLLVGSPWNFFSHFTSVIYILIWPAIVRLSIAFCSLSYNLNVLWLMVLWMGREGRARPWYFVKYLHLPPKLWFYLTFGGRNTWVCDSSPIQSGFLENGKQFFP